MPLKLAAITRNVLFKDAWKVMKLWSAGAAIRTYTVYTNCEKLSGNFCHSVIFRGLQLSTASQQCWRCGSMKITGLFCSQCGALLKPNDKLNYFQVLGVAESYNVKYSELSTKFRELQSYLHPDRYTNKDEVEQQVSAEYSALVNKAYSTLSHPLQRGLYLLQMRGLQVEEGTVQDDPGFLMEIMELNEELAQAKDPEHMRRLDAGNRLVIEQLTKEVAEAFDKGDLDAAKQALTKMKYYASIGGRIKELKQKSGVE